MSKTKNSAKAASKKLKAFQKKLITADRDVTVMSDSKRDLESQRNKLLEQKKTHWRRGDDKNNRSQENAVCVDGTA